MHDHIKILLIDGNENRRRRTTNLLEKECYQVLSADPGDEALKLAQQENPDIILVDDHANGRNGDSLCQQFKTDPILKNAFVIRIAEASSHNNNHNNDADEVLIRPKSDHDFLTYIRLVHNLRCLKKELHKASEPNGHNGTPFQTEPCYCEIQEDFFHSLFDSLHEDIFIIDCDYKIVDINTKTSNTTGYKKEDIIGRPCYEISHNYDKPCDFYGEECLLKEVFITGEPRTCHHTHKKLGGIDCQVDILFSPLKDTKGNVTHVIKVVRDVTDLLKTRKELEITKFALEHTSESVFWVTRDAQFLYVNKAAYQALGYSREELLNMGIADINPLFTKEKWQRHWQNLRKNKQIIIESKHITKDGRIFPVEILANLIEYEGQEILCAFIRDITERKKHEEELFGAKEQLKAVFDASDEYIFSKDKEGTYTSVNKTVSDLLEKPIEEIVGKRDRDIFPAKEAEALRAIDRQVIEKGEKVKSFDKMIIRGREYVFRTTKVPLRDIQGNIIGIAGFAEDITERKKAEEALKQEQRLMNLFMENIPDAIYFKDLQGRFIRINKVQAERFGLSDPAQAIGKTDHDFFVKENALESEQEIKEVIETGRIIIKERKKTNNQGKTYWVLSTLVPMRDENGNIIGVFGITRDITLQKTAEEALRESETRLRSITSAALDAIVMIDSKGRVTFWNQAAEKMFGYKKEEMLGKNFHSIVAPEKYRKKFQHTFAKFQKDGKGKVLGKILELEGRHKNGTIFPVGVSVAPVNFHDSWHAVGIIRDITQRKKTEQELRTLSQAVEQSPVSVIITDKQGNIEYVNRAFTEITGYNFNEVKGKNPRILKSGETSPKEYKKLWETITQGNVWHGEFHNKKNDGQLYWEDATIGPIFDENGQIKQFIGLKMDITERKNLEEKLVREHELLQALMDNIPDTIYFKDTKSRFTRINKAHARELKLNSPDEAVGKTDFDFFHKDHAIDAYNDEQQIIKTGKPLIGKIEHVKYFDRPPRWVSTTKVPIRDPRGKIVGLVGISRDITKQKQMEEMVIKNEQELRQIIDLIPDMVYAKDKDGRFLFVNKAVAEALGTTVDELTGKYHIDVHPDAKVVEKWLREDRQVLRTGKPLFNPEEKLVDVHGNVHWLQTIKVPFSTPKTPEPAVLGISFDITDLKVKEEQIQKNLNEKEVLLKEIHHRVKNNMQVIKSILSLQAQATNDPKFTQAANECMNRIHSMALVHEKMYQSGDFAQIDFKSYIEAMAHDLLIAYFRSNISMQLEISDIALNLEKAIPCGLILNELITNAIKYAFPDGQQGRILIMMRPFEKDKYELIVQDDGVGLPPDVDIENTESLGLKLVQVLTEQIDGTLELKNNGGTHFRIVFPGK